MSSTMTFESIIWFLMYLNIILYLILKRYDNHGMIHGRFDQAKGMAKRRTVRYETV